ncbi:cytosine permease [Pseudomonas sp. NPDC087029]|uniref:cytosine permease n=1 Tax=Pseudomonas sp. NPDC087029 TaxID=3364433 RepID=UPI003804C0CC
MFDQYLKRWGLSRDGEAFASLNGNLLPVRTAINLVDFYAVRHGRYSITEIFNPNGIYGRWNWRGIGAYLVGFIAMLPFSNTGLYTGYIAEQLGGADISMPIGLAVSALVYLGLCRTQNIESELTALGTADLRLDNGTAG